MVTADVWQIVNRVGQRVLERGTRQILEPDDNQVLVAIRAVSLNYRDSLQLDGTYNSRQPLPLIPCSDAAGVVIAAGSGVRRFKIGDRVVNHSLPGWFDGPFRSDKTGTMYGGPDDGTLATHRLFPADTLLPVPDHLSDQEAGTLTCAGLTAWGAIITHGRAKPGDTIVIQGTGGVSLFALQFAKMTGLRTIITSSSDEKLERAVELGADYGVNYLRDRWSTQVRALTAGVGADLVLEVAGTIDESVRACRGGGTVLSIGVLAGAKPVVDLPMIVMRAIRLQGVTLGSFAEMRDMVAAISVSRMRPIVDRVFSFENASAAFDYYRSGSAWGKVVVSVPHQ